MNRLIIRVKSKLFQNYSGKDEKIFAASVILVCSKTI